MKLRETGTCLLASVLVLQMLLGALPFRTSGQITWTIQVVAGPGDAGEDGVSLTYNAVGNPHIAYRNTTGTSLDRVYWNGVQWVQEAIFQPREGYHPSLKIDISGIAHVAYRDQTDLAYSENSGGWAKTAVDNTGTVGFFASMVLRGGTLPSVSYYDAGNTALKYASFDGATWTKTTVDNTASVGQFSSIALDTSGNPHIAYYDATGLDLKHAWWNGTAWQIETVDSAGSVGEYCSIAIDSSNKIHISYASETGPAFLKYALKTGAIWSFQTVDPSPNVGLHTSIGLTGSGVPAIAYYDAGNTRLKFAVSNGVSWNTEVVDDQGASGDVGQYASLAIDPSGNPGIAYWDAINNDVKYAHGPLLYPDMEVAPGDILFTPPQPYDMGAAVDVNATIHNLGNENATNVVVRFYDGSPIPANQIDGDKVIPFLAKGGTAGVNVTWTAQTVGQHCINTVVDPDNAIAEFSESNNAAVNCVQVNGADLLLSQSRISWSPPGDVPLSSSVLIEANVTNQGTGNASSVLLRFWDGLPGTTQIGGDQVIPSILIGGYVIANVTWTAQPAGSHQICVQADPANTISETNETNNDACINIIVTLPDLEVHAGDLTAEPPGMVFDGTPMFLNLTYRNAGGLPSAGATVSLYDGLPGSGSEVLIGDIASPPMSPGAVQTANWTWTANQSKVHTFYAVLDRTNSLAELNESNNMVSVLVVVMIHTDFLTTSLNATPPGPVAPGAMVDLSATWENQETTTGTAEFVIFEDLNSNFGLDTGEALASWRLTLGSMQNATRNVIWSSVTPGTHILCALADSQDEVAETSEVNNQVCITVDVLGKPDLIPTNPLPLPPIIVGIGQMVQLSLQVRNQGGSNAGSSSLAFYNQSEPLPFDVFAVPPLDAGALSARYTAIWPAPNVTGTYNVTASVDDGNAVDESNELNNNQFFRIVVSTLPQTRLYIGMPNYTSSVTFISSSTPITLVAYDFSGLGIQQTLYRIDGGLYSQYTSPFVLLGEGAHLVEYFSQDNAGNVELAKTANFTVDNTPPTSAHTIGIPSYGVGGIWIDFTTEMSLSAADNPVVSCGLKTTQYRVYDGSNWGPWTIYSSNLTFFDEATYILEYASIDRLGNTEVTNSLSFKVDNTPPTVTPNVGMPRYRRSPGNSWNITPASSITISSIDQGATAVGVQLTEYSVDMGAWTPYTIPITALQQGPHSISFRSSDKLGHESPEYNVTVNVDSTPPTMSVQVGTPKYVAVNTWVTSATLITLVSVDGGSPPVGVESTKYRVWGGTWTGWIEYTAPFPLGAPQGQRYIEIESNDYLDNEGITQNVSLLVDDSPPTGQIAISDPKYVDPAQTLFVSAKTEFTLSGVDVAPTPSGLANLQYDLDGLGWAAYSSPFNISSSGEGPHTIAYNATDSIGHFSTGSKDVVLDKTPPATQFQASLRKGNGTFWLNASDARVGVNSTYYSIDLGALQKYTGPITLTTGNYRIYYYSDDRLGNEEALKSVPLNVTAGNGGGGGGGGGPTAEETNLAPAIGAVLGIILVAAGFAFRKKSRKAMAAGILVGVVDVVTGISSLFIGDMKIPPWGGLGLIVLIALFAVGIIVVMLLARRGKAVMEKTKRKGAKKIEREKSQPVPRKAPRIVEDKELVEMEEEEEAEEPDQSDLDEALKSLEELEE